VRVDQSVSPGGKLTVGAEYTLGFTDDSSCQVKVVSHDLVNNTYNLAGATVWDEFILANNYTRIQGISYFADGQAIFIQLFVTETLASWDVRGVKTVGNILYAVGNVVAADPIHIPAVGAKLKRLDITGYPTIPPNPNSSISIADPGTLFALYSEAGVYK